MIFGSRKVDKGDKTRERSRVGGGLEVDDKKKGKKRWEGGWKRTNRQSAQMLARGYIDKYFIGGSSKEKWESGKL